jgi:hypothetical protein
LREYLAGIMMHVPKPVESQPSQPSQSQTSQPRVKPEEEPVESQKTSKHFAAKREYWKGRFRAGKVSERIKNKFKKLPERNSFQGQPEKDEETDEESNIERRARTNYGQPVEAEQEKLEEPDVEADQEKPEEPNDEADQEEPAEPNVEDDEEKWSAWVVYKKPRTKQKEPAEPDVEASQEEPLEPDVEEPVEEVKPEEPELDEVKPEKPDSEEDSQNTEYYTDSEEDSPSWMTITDSTGGPNWVYQRHTGLAKFPRVPLRFARLVDPDERAHYDQVVDEWCELE